MPINFIEPPIEYMRVLQEGLGTIAQAYKHNESDHFMGTTFANDQIEMPHQVFSISLDALREKKNISNAIADGWRCFLKEIPPIRVAEATWNAAISRIAFLGISVGPQVDSTKALLTQLLSEQSREPLAFVPRLLRINPLYLACLWLSATDTMSDIFIPLPPVFSPFRKGHRYGLAEFNPLLQTAASARKPNKKVLFGN